MNNPERRRAAAPHVYTRRRFIAAGTAVLVPTFVVTQLRSGATGKQTAVTPPPPPAVTPEITTSLTLPPPAPTSLPPQTAAPAALTRSLRDGMSGDQVTMVQDRLRRLGFDPGPSDGGFGPATERAVWAFEKFLLGTARDQITGVVTADMWQKMSQPHDIQPRRPGTGVHLEVMLPEQVAVLYDDDAVRVITHISSGSGDDWCAVVKIDQDDGTQTEEGICGKAVTPGGVFHFERRFVGWRESKLGRLYNPVYFNFGLAVHGASNVPKVPASHGCVRIPMHIAEYFPSLVKNGDAVYIFDGVKEPEIYGAQGPVWDQPDPSFVPPSTTSTTTPVPTTTNPSSTTSTTPPTTHPHTTTTVALSETTTTAPASTVATTAPPTTAGGAAGTP